MRCTSVLLQDLIRILAEPLMYFWYVRFALFRLICNFVRINALSSMR